MKPLRVAIVGATGLVGETLVHILEERCFPVGDLLLFASARSAGTKMKALGKEIEVQSIDPGRDIDFATIDLAFFAAGRETSLALAPRAAEQGAVVVDKSEAFRLHSDIPLVVPEVNADSVGSSRLIANPNCATIPVAMMLGPIRRRFGLHWASVSTYQSVSGAGRDALREFERQLRDDKAPVKALPHRIAGNLFPENGSFDETGYSEEERKIAAELKKILGDPALRVSATSVRVPVAVSHGEAISFQTERRASREDIAQALREAPGVKFLEGAGYATPLETTGTDDVVVGRLRADSAHPSGYLAWVTSDNLRKGAATNAVQIAEIALSHGRVVA